MSPDFRDAIRIKKKYCYELLVNRNVVGVGVGLKTTKNVETRNPCVKIYVGEKLPAANLETSQIIPSNIEGIPTDVVEFGVSRLKVRLETSSYRLKVRPVPIGVSVGHYALRGAGTVGGYAKDKETGDILLMSNWHVFTNYGQGKKGDAIIQPASIDGGTVEKDTVAFLEKWVDVKMLGPVLGEAKSNLKAYLDRGTEPPINRVDVAFAKPISKDIIPEKGARVTNRLQKKHATIGEHIFFIGRTSGISGGSVIDTNATMWVDYNIHGIALFDDISLAKAKSLPGDSGAPIYSYY